MEGLLEISGCDNPSRIADVIFVHGLDGNARTAWHPKDKPEDFWPAWLGQDFPNVGIWSLGYAVSASAWKGHSMPLYDRANNTLDCMQLDGIGRRPIGFVCHSLGGLLIKQVLRNAKDSNNPAWQAITRQTRFIVFLSTPHSGASLASWIRYIGKLLRTTVSVEELKAHHPQLRQLNIWYRDHVAELGIINFVYCEERKTGGFLEMSGFLVVDKTTADPGIPGVTPISLDEDHISICKPASKDAQVYRQVKRMIEETIVNSQSAPMVSDAPHSESKPGTASQPGIRYPGTVKITICDRLHDDWSRLADYLEIPIADRRRFERGREPQGVWEWLYDRGKLGLLEAALSHIGRDDLAAELKRPPR